MKARSDDSSSCWRWCVASFLWAAPLTSSDPRSLCGFVRSHLFVLMGLAAPCVDAVGAPSVDVLVVTGGHAFHRDAFFEMFSANACLSVTEAPQYEACEAYEHPQFLESDVVVLYDMVQHASDAQKERLSALTERGIGLVVLHHALVSHQDWPEFEKIIGGTYPEESGKEGLVSAALGYKHNVEFDVQPVARHPVTAGLKSFRLLDEIYWGFRTSREVTPLLTTPHPKSGNPLAWAHRYNNSRIVVIQPGHGPQVFKDPHYRRLIYQSLLWTTGNDMWQAIGEIRQFERERVLELASGALKAEPLVITQFPAPLSQGGIHDFYSNGDYWWPDPDQPHGLPYVKRDGESNPDNFVSHRNAICTTRDHVAALATAYMLTKDDRYVEKAVQLLEEFFLDTDSKMEPHLKYAQAIPGRTSGRGIGIIDGLHLIEVPRAVNAMRDSPAMPAEVVAGMKQWFARMSKWMQTSENGREEASTTNNHRVAYYLQLAVYSEFTDDRELQAKCRAEFVNNFLAKQMDQDGSFPRELERTKPYGYSIFQLDNMATMCQLLSSRDDDLWRLRLDDGRGIQRAIEFMFPYLASKEMWPYEPDIQAWEGWPVRQPALLFAGLALNEPKYINLWKKLPSQVNNPEVRRNMAITQPLLWLDDRAARSFDGHGQPNTH